MLLHELLEEKKNEKYDNIEVYKEIGSGHGFHGDFIELVADKEYCDSGLYDYWNAEILDYEEMDAEDYYNTIYANGCISKEDADFEGYTLVIKIDDYDYAGFSNELEAYREELDLSMKEAADCFEIPYRTWQDWEGNKRQPSDWVIRLLFNELDRMIVARQNKIDSFDGIKWGDLNKAQKYELLSASNPVDGRTGNNMTEDGDCIIDLTYGLSVPGRIENGEIIIEDDDEVYNPAV